MRRAHRVIILFVWAAMVLAAVVPLDRGIRILRDIARVQAETNPYRLSPEALSTRPAAAGQPIPAGDLNLISAALSDRWREAHNQRLRQALRRRPIGIGLVVLCPVLITTWTGIAWLLVRRGNA